MVPRVGGVSMFRCAMRPISALSLPGSAGVADVFRLDPAIRLASALSAGSLCHTINKILDYDYGFCLKSFLVPPSQKRIRLSRGGFRCAST